MGLSFSLPSSSALSFHFSHASAFIRISQAYTGRVCLLIYSCPPLGFLPAIAHFSTAWEGFTEPIITFQQPALPAEGDRKCLVLGIGSGGVR